MHWLLAGFIYSLEAICYMYLLTLLKYQDTGYLLFRTVRYFNLFPRPTLHCLSNCKWGVGDHEADLLDDLGDQDEDKESIPIKLCQSAYCLLTTWPGQRRDGLSHCSTLLKSRLQKIITYFSVWINLILVENFLNLFLCIKYFVSLINVGSIFPLIVTVANR